MQYSEDEDEDEDEDKDEEEDEDEDETETETGGFIDDGRSRSPPTPKMKTNMKTK